MKKTEIQIPEYSFKISHADRLFFIGSCFSDHISKKTSEVGIPTFQQPLGVVFNPYSIAEFITYCITERSLGDTIFKRNDVFLSWIANSEIHAYRKSELERNLKQLSEETLEQIKNCNYLFITFGTAWVYRLLAKNRIVANCHKAPSNEFQKELLQPHDIANQWTALVGQLQKINPTLKILFTVSPVRHLKDGLTPNFVSKSILRTAIYQLQQDLACCYYFPAYEKVIDELRDYSYFEKDGLHPNEYATDEVWKLFKTALLKTSTQEIIEGYLQLKKSLRHKPLHPKSEESVRFQKQMQQKLNTFKKKHPSINFRW